MKRLQLYNIFFPLLFSLSLTTSAAAARHTHTQRMGKVAALFRPWQNNTTSLIMSMQYTGGAHFTINGRKWGSKPKKQQQCHLLLMRRRRRSCSFFESKAMMVTPPSTYSSTIATDNPLSESPFASFDSYLDNKPRVFRAIFAHQQRTKRLNEEEWRIDMLPIQFLFLNARPIIDMRLRCKSKGKDYPAGVPCHISKILELKIIRWDLQGIDEILKPSHFSLGVDGALYPDRHGKESRLRGQLQIKMSFVHPPVLDFVPEDIRRHVAESVRPSIQIYFLIINALVVESCYVASDQVLKRLMENLKDGMNGSLLADYSEFKREKSRLRKDL
ncbi:hypothetical protein LguiB_013294 [Lonicera macranthoides]